MEYGSPILTTVEKLLLLSPSFVKCSDPAQLSIMGFHQLGRQKKEAELLW